MTQSSDKPRDAPVPRRGGAPELPELQHLDAARNSANDLGLQFVEFGLIDDATILEVGKTVKLVGRRGARCVADVVLHRCILSLCGFDLMLVHLAATNDEVGENGKKVEGENGNNPDGLMEAAHVTAAENVDEDTDR